MKKLLFLSISAAIILTGCGSNKTFTKKHHGHRSWIKVGEKVEHRDFAENKSKFNDEDITGHSKKGMSSMESESLILDDYNEPLTRSSNELKAKNSNDQPSKREERSKAYSDTDVLEEVQNVESEMPTKVHDNTMQPESMTNRKEIKEKSTGELIMLALLIVLIIVVFSLIDGILGGLLGLLLVVFLVLLALRYFGVI